MCGRIVVDYEEMMSVADATELSEWITHAPAGAASSWNIAPTQNIPVAFTDPRTGDKRFKAAFWSLLPAWAKDAKPKFPTFNARSETVAEKPTFRPSLKAQRCAIPVTAFYEWTGPKNARVPHAIRAAGPVMVMAGLYSWWQDMTAPSEAESWKLTATVLTQQSTGRMAPLHDRMPVFLAPELTRDWLDPQTLGTKQLVDAVTAHSVPLADELRIHEVAKLAGDGPQLLDPPTLF